MRLAIAMALLALGPTSAPALADDALFFQTNAPQKANEVGALVARDDGTFTDPTMFPTGGSGTGKPIESQGMLTISGRYLLALNTKSPAISALRIGGGTLKLTDKTGTQGFGPTSVAAAPNGRIVVLNAGKEGGFRHASLARLQLTDGEFDKLGGFGLGSGVPYAVALSARGSRAAVSFDDATVQTAEWLPDRLRRFSFETIRRSTPSALSFTSERNLLVASRAGNNDGLFHLALGKRKPDPSRRLDSLPGLGTHMTVQGPSGWTSFVSGVRSFRVKTDGSLKAGTEVELDGDTSDITASDDGERLYALNRTKGGVRVLALDAKTLETLGASAVLPDTAVGLTDVPNAVAAFPVD